VEGGAEGQEVDLRRWLSGVARRKALVLALVVGLVGAALLLSAMQTPVYRAEAQILIQPGASESLFDSQGSSVQPNADVRIDTEIQVLKGKPVQAAVAEKLGAVPDVGAHRVAKTLIVELAVESTSAKRATTVVNEYATTYIDMRRAQETDDVLGAGAQVSLKISDQQAQLDQLDRRIADAPSAQKAGLTAERDSVARQQALFKQRLDELQVEAALKSGGAQLVAAATQPTSPVRPTPVRNAILALVVGALLGVGLASLLEYLDDRIRSKDDLTRAAGSLPTLGLIPLVPSWNKGGRRLELVTHSDDDAPAAEAYRGLRTSVQMLGVERPLTTIQFTSPGAAEGKTTTLCNLAEVIAEAGRRVVVVDCDLRRPRVHDAFGVPNGLGFTSVLAGDVPLDEAVRTVDGQPNLSVLTAGPIPPNPSELLGSKKTSELLFKLQSDFEVVLVDSPPVLPVTDATVLSTWMDATVMMAAAGVTTRKQLRAAVELLRQAEAPVAGVVLNRAKAEERYGYAYRYAEEPPKASRRRRRGGGVEPSPNGHRARSDGAPLPESGERRAGGVRAGRDDA
jgi:succinoglycan biosynthesis transport protein ExoP